MIKLKLEQKHIDKAGKRQSTCPIALSMKDRGFKNPRVPGTAVMTGTLYAQSQHGPHATRYVGIDREEQQAIMDFIRNYDEKGKKAVKPTTFKIQPAETYPHNHEAMREHIAYRKANQNEHTS